MGRQHFFGEAAAGIDIVGGYRLVTGIKTKPAVLPGEQIIRLFPGEEFLPDEEFDETVAEDLDEGARCFHQA